MKYYFAIVLSVVALTCFGDNDYYKWNNPLYMSLTQAQIKQIQWIEDDKTISSNEMKQKISEYLTTQGGNIASLYNEYVANQTSLLNEVKRVRLELINNSTMSDSAKNAKRQIDEISTNENLTKNDKKNQIRQIKANLPLSVLNELENFDDGRMNSFNNGYVIGRVNNGLRNYNHSGEDIFDFDFDDIYEIAKRSINTPISRVRRHI